MSSNKTLISFREVTYEYERGHPLLDEVNFNVREGTKITIMGQNGAGKSTIFKLITGDLKPKIGAVNIFPGVTIGIARQVLPRTDLTCTVLEFFQKCFTETIYDIERRIDNVLDIVNLKAPIDKQLKDFSGGQQARLLLAAAIIQDPDVLLLDEPTNNLDPAGIAHLTSFIQNSPKTCIVISHDADFLNSFTDGVLYLDVHTQRVDQYVGNYYDLQEEIEVRREKENMKNARLAKEIQANKDQANVFAHKGGKLRSVAKRMREKAESLDEERVEIRKEDRKIRPFIIPAQEGLSGKLLGIDSFTVMYGGSLITEKKADVILQKNDHLLLAGPNGIGKSTLLEAMATGKAPGAKIKEGLTVGYYRQDFSNLDFEDTVYHSLMLLKGDKSDQEIRGLAAGFLITGDIINRKIGSLSEGQKGLVAFAQLVLTKPAILILDEPTNHINFRHLPIIAKALHEFKGAMILVSHDPEFVAQVRIDQTLDLDA